MANELPYFRFTVQAWQNGKIGIERNELQGLFISICGYYWVQDCSITLALLKKKFINDVKLVDELIELSILKHEKRHDKVEIEFLNIQFDLLSEKRKLRQAAGSKGGNAKAKSKQKDGYKYNNKDNNNISISKDNIEERKLKFASTLEPFFTTYGKDLLREFYKYWTEPNKSNTKFRQELEKTWDLERRIETWAKNDKNFNKGKKDFVNHALETEKGFDIVKQIWKNEEDGNSNTQLQLD